MTLAQLLVILGYAADIIAQIGRLIDIDRRITPEDMDSITARMDAVDADFDDLLKEDDPED